MSRCDFAGCQRVATQKAARWVFCDPHLTEHRQLVAHDTYLERARITQLRAEQQTRSACRGGLLPSGSLRAVLRVLGRAELHEQAS